MARILRAALIIGAVLGITALTLSSGASAQDQPGTAAQKRACTPDVYRLCAAEIPSVRAITRCLRANMSQLSPDCRAVFAGELR